MTEAYQIIAMLLKHYTFSETQFTENMDKILAQNCNTLLSKDVISNIKEVVLSFDVEDIHYKIKTLQPIEEFSDRITTMIVKLMQNHAEYIDNDIVQQVYKTIAECFVFTSVDDNILLNERQHWACNNCSNFNFNSYIAGSLNCDLSVCILCGIQQTQSIILKLRNTNTFINNNEDASNDTNQNSESTRKEIDEMMNTVFKNGSFNIICPNRYDEQPCPAIWSLCKTLIVYKHWLQKIDGKVNDTNDIGKYVDDEMLKTILIKTANLIPKLKNTDLDLITKVIKEQTSEDQTEIEAFLQMSKKQFCTYLKTQIKFAISKKFYSKVLEGLQQKYKEAQTKSFTKFLSALDMNIINKQYYHVLKTHINSDHKYSTQETFRFFETAVHYEDVESERAKCPSKKRRNERAAGMCSDNKEEKKENDNTETNNIHKAKQYYKQVQVDIIHSHLVHSKSQNFIQRYSNKYDK
eukprot:208622_1